MSEHEINVQPKADRELEYDELVSKIKRGQIVHIEGRTATTLGELHFVLEAAGLASMEASGEVTDRPGILIEQSVRIDDLERSNQELSGENAELQTKNAELAAKNGDLSAQVDALTKQLAAVQQPGIAAIANAAPPVTVAGLEAGTVDGADASKPAKAAK